jgi:serine/threonine protein kinase
MEAVSRHRHEPEAQVALKVLPAAIDPDRLTRFQREAEVLAALNHPNIAHVFGLEKADGTFALVMELVDRADAGGSGKARFRSTRRYRLAGRSPWSV